MKRKKDFLIALIGVSLYFPSFAQSNSSFNLRIGLESKTVLVKTLETNPTSFFWNKGFRGQAIFKKNWIVGLGVNHSERTYGSELGNLVFQTNLPSGSISSKYIEVFEKMIEVENQFLFQFLNSDIKPFFGLGYSFQLPYLKQGRERPAIGNEPSENLIDLKNSTNSFLYSVYPVLGITIALPNRLHMALDLGPRWVYNSNFRTYTFPIINGDPNVHKSFVIGLALLYTMK